MSHIYWLTSLPFDSSIPLTDVVDCMSSTFILVFFVLSFDALIAFQVFFSNQGSQGILHKPSRQQLENVFETHKDVDVVSFILQKGVAQSGEGIQNSNFGSTNANKGSFSIDTRGKTLTGV